MEKMRRRWHWPQDRLRLVIEQGEKTGDRENKDLSFSLGAGTEGDRVVASRESQALEGLSYYAFLSPKILFIYLLTYLSVYLFIFRKREN